MNTNKKLIAAAVMSLGVSASAWSGDIINFDWNGMAAGGALTDVATFDWAVGNALSIGGSPAGGIKVGDESTLLYQAALSAIRDSANQALFVNGFLGAPHFTVVAGFGETATAAGPDAAFAFNPLNPVNFFKIYANGATPANDLLGTGFTTGTLILDGMVLGAGFTSNFSADVDASGMPVTAIYDQFGIDNYSPGPVFGGPGGYTSIVGSGGTSLNVEIKWVDDKYFTDGLAPGGLLSVAFNTSQKTPFQEANPSKCFINTAGTADCVTVPDLAAINGLNMGPDPVKDFQIQVDGNNSFMKDRNVPEPGSLALISLGLLGFAAARGKKRA